MQQTKSVEISTGLFVALGFAAILFLATQTTSNSIVANDVYRVTARFQNVGSLKVRAPVSMAGVTIGRIEAIDIDPEILDAVVTMAIDQRYEKIPEDSDASILTAGLLGTQYIGLQPGGSDLFLEEGSVIEFTQSAIVLENLIGKFLVNQGE
ncbi:MAG: outer membrane lipid asymmetry maintenance protein MlaD [Pseudomonadota bacterium]